MADFALRLKVFIASPSDVQAERDIAEREIVALQGECARERLLLEPYRWEGRVPPSLRRVQAGINVELRSAELTIAILASRLGSVAKTGETGSLEEIRIAGERVARGYADDVFLYFKTNPPADGPPNDVQAVDEFRHRMTDAEGAFIATFADGDEFTRRVRQDLRAWVSRYFGVPDICAFALRGTPADSTTGSIGENRLARLKVHFDPFADPACMALLGASAIRLYQERGLEAATASLPKQVTGRNPPRATLAFPLRNPSAPYQRLIDAGVLASPGDGSLRFGHEEWFFFYCASGLLDAVAAGDVSAVERRPYINPIHQYLQAIAVGPKRTALVPVLRRWLVNADGVTEGKPIARNFAAYVLGMANAIESQEDMARVIQEDPGEDVQTYCVASLGRMRARGQLPVLVELFRRTDAPRSRLMIAQAVSRMIGIADYAL